MFSRISVLLGFIAPIAIGAGPVSSASAQEPAVREVHATISKVEQLPQFSVEAVERLFNVNLKGDPRLEGSDPKATIPEGPFSEVAAFENRPRRAPHTWHITLTVRRSAGIPFGAIDRKFVGPHRAASEGPRGPIKTSSLPLPGGLLHLSYGLTSGALEAVKFVREGSPERTVCSAAFSKATKQARQIESLIAKVDSLTELSKAEIEKVLGVVLAPSSRAGPNARTWEATMSDGVFSHVRYQQVDHPTLPTTSLSLTLSPVVALSTRFLDPNLSFKRLEARQQASPEPIRFYDDLRPGTRAFRVLLGVGENTEHLRRIVFAQRGSSPSQVVPPQR